MTEATLDQRLAQYKRDGYTIFKNYMSARQLTQLRPLLDSEFAGLFAAAPDRPRRTIVPVLGHPTVGPQLADHMVNPRALDFAERVMGPYVQLDSFEVTGFPVKNPDQRGQVHHWHRDAFNLTEQWMGYAFKYEQGQRPYTPPMACNCITYLQDMDEQTGPLRLIPGSHLDYTSLAEEERHRPHPRERLVDLAAGDMVFTHCELLHSGSLNTSDQVRYFLSIYFQRFGLPHRDTFDLPIIDRLVEWARARNDRRVLRLFGHDGNFIAREEAAWQRMTEQDRAALRT